MMSMLTPQSTLKEKKTKIHLLKL